VNLRQHKLALCRDHYLQWVPEQTELFRNKYKMFNRDDRVLLAVSGGKDYLARWDILTRLRNSVDGLYIELEIDGGIGYGQRSYTYVRNFADERDVHMIVVDVQSEKGATTRSSRILHAAEKENRAPCAA